jgi:hypothetical protein
VRAAQAPVLDGRDDDPAWRLAPATSRFLEFSPNEGKAPRYATAFRVACDDRNLCVFVRAVDPVGVKRDYAMYDDTDEDESWTPPRSGAAPSRSSASSPGCGTTPPSWRSGAPSSSRARGATASA